MGNLQHPETSSELYNATVVAVCDVHESLRILRVAPDRPLGQRLPGQYTALGLGVWESPRGEGSRHVATAKSRSRSSPAPGKLIKRSYSLSCSLLNEQRELSNLESFSYYEFYVNLIESSDANALSPRLFAVEQGSRIALGPKVAGRYTLAGIKPYDQVILVATGTGEAPHNAMVAELLMGGHSGAVISAVCVRHKQDLAYLQAHRELEQRYSNYRYLTLTTREPENLDPTVPGFVGTRRLQELFDSGEFERQMECRLDPRSTHVFLCGNPAMIGAPQRLPDGTVAIPESRGMVAVLLERGFQLELPRQPGNVHFESYW